MALRLVKITEVNFDVVFSGQFEVRGIFIGRSRLANQDTCHLIEPILIKFDGLTHVIFLLGFGMKNVHAVLDSKLDTYNQGYYFQDAKVRK